ncbi:phosphotyrosyl phosphatase activator, putative [Perkinsus marinus ATCC 50983]|uniref:Serine/threonine-protein phosphatase 2A activator n=1 Tax=Perkinsus marinus (strain ATCC 50983 / TXsc) TaxID=423536 RepID=C5LVK0_PERM5|nr:phosphotyrosyl phosphatase activator, putative [Perkinsus marinus ATCC 50983]EEQ99248.1 phosphotyrosyl phosphatase activator, putative [Perkinsus marinus ATCC 50983]|eukprot:XP_002766531.1 phosphotyrosyl phosphatase activator, putative [Perkinsus marinus ATCC 50983]
MVCKREYLETFKTAFPQPVIYGFFVAVGLAMIESSLKVVVGEDILQACWTNRIAFAQCLTSIGFGLLNRFGSRYLRHYLALPGLLLTEIAVVYVCLAACGMSVEEAREEVPIETCTNEGELNMRSELVRAGVTNLACGASGGGVCYMSLSPTRLNEDAAVWLVCGGTVLEFIPKPWAAGMLLHLAFGYILEGAWDPRQVLTRSEFVAYRDIAAFLERLCTAVQGKKILDIVDYTTAPRSVGGVMNFIGELETWLKDIPPLQQPMRFGNIAFRSWHNRLADRLPRIFDRILGPELQPAVIELTPYIYFGLPRDTEIELERLSFAEVTHARYDVARVFQRIRRSCSVEEMRSQRARLVAQGIFSEMAQNAVEIINEDDSWFTQIYVALARVVEHWGADLYPVFRRLCRDALALPGKNLPAVLQEVTTAIKDALDELVTEHDLQVASIEVEMLHVPSEEESNEGEDATGRSHVFDPSDRGTCLGCGETGEDIFIS